MPMFLVTKKTQDFEHLMSLANQHSSKLLWVAIFTSLWMLAGKIVEADMDWTVIPCGIGMLLGYLAYRLKQNKLCIQHRNKLLWFAVAVSFWMLAGQIVEADLDWTVIPCFIGMLAGYLAYRLNHKKLGGQPTATVEPQKQSQTMPAASKAMWVALAIPSWLVSDQIVDADLDWMVIPAWMAMMALYVAHRLKSKKAMWMVLAATLAAPFWIASGWIVDADLDWVVIPVWIAMMAALVAQRLRSKMTMWVSLAAVVALPVWAASASNVAADLDLMVIAWCFALMAAYVADLRTVFSSQPAQPPQPLEPSTTVAEDVAQVEDIAIPAEETTSALCRVAETLKGSQKKDSEFIISELQAYLQDQPDKQHMALVNDLVEDLARQKDAYLVDLIASMLPAMNLCKNQRTFEIMLPMHIAKHNFVKARRLLAEMATEEIEVEAPTKVAMLNMALQEDDFEMMLQTFVALKDHWDIRSIWGVSPWAVEHRRLQIIDAIVDLACKEHKLSQVLPLLEGMQVNDEAVNAMLADCLSTDDLPSTKLVEAIARANQAPLKDSTYTLLIQCRTSRRSGARRAIVQEAVWRDSQTFSEELALTIIDFCGRSACDRALADKLYQQMEPKSTKVLASFVDLYVVDGHCKEALNILQSNVPAFNGEYLKHPLTHTIGARAGWNVMLKALESGEISMANHLFKTAASSTEKHVTLIQNWWKHGLARKAQNAQLFDVTAVQEVSSRLSSVFQKMSLDLDEEIAASLNRFEQPVKVARAARPLRARRVSFADEAGAEATTDEDGSTSAGTSSDSESESVDDWMTKAAWSPPLKPQQPAAFDLPELPDPWEAIVVN